jgi:protease II
MSVDEGLDIVATKGERLFRIQVKTTMENKFNKYVFNISMTSFAKNESYNTFYVFVLRGNETNSLVFPYNIIKKNIDEGIVTPDRNRKYKVEVTRSDGNYFLGKSRSENITYYKNRWDIIR